MIPGNPSDTGKALILEYLVNALIFKNVLLLSGSVESAGGETDKFA